MHTIITSLGKRLFINIGSSIKSAKWARPNGYTQYQIRKKSILLFGRLSRHFIEKNYTVLHLSTAESSQNSCTIHCLCKCHAVQYVTTASIDCFTLSSNKMLHSQVFTDNKWSIKNKRTTGGRLEKLSSGHSDKKCTLSSYQPAAFKKYKYNKGILMWTKSRRSSKNTGKEHMKAHKCGTNLSQVCEVQVAKYRLNCQAATWLSRCHVLFFYGRLSFVFRAWHRKRKKCKLCTAKHSLFPLATYHP